MPHQLHAAGRGGKAGGRKGGKREKGSEMRKPLRLLAAVAFSLVAWLPASALATDDNDESQRCG